jgi:putative oxidoreductase
MRSKAVIVARVLLGLVFFVFGLNGFLHWFPLPTMKGAAAEFMGGLVASGYFFPLLFGTYTITGAHLEVYQHLSLKSVDKAYQDAVQSVGI